MILYRSSGLLDEYSGLLDEYAHGRKLAETVFKASSV
jgi:hypothetical protein